MSLKTSKGFSEAVNRRMTDKSKKTNRQTIVHKTLHRSLKNDEFHHICM